MKKFIIILVVVLSVHSISGFPLNTDSTGVKKNFHTIEACVGISPKAHRKYVTSSKGYIMYGLWYDYSLKVKNNFYASFIVNPLVGGDESYNESYYTNSFSFRTDKTNYLLLNTGMGIKYKLNLSKSTPQKNCLIFTLGAFGSYKCTYKNTHDITGMRYNPPENYTYTNTYHYNLSSDINRLSKNSVAFPIYLKLSYCRKRVTLSLIEHFLTSEYAYKRLFYERFYTNINIGVIL